MSEHQYYEFRALDRPLDANARAKLRSISSRATITASSFTNTYEWGNLKTDPLHLLERYFDVFLYVSNWGTRRFAMKLPRRLVDVETLESSLPETDELVTLTCTEEHAILDIMCDEVYDDDETEDGTGWLDNLALVRTELLAGERRLLPLLWLIAVDAGRLDDNAVEPPPGLGTLSHPLAALAEFLGLTGDLLDAATSASAAEASEPSSDEIERVLREIPDRDKVAMLLRLYRGEPHLGFELQHRVRAALTGPVSPQTPLRTAGELRAAARAIEEKRKRIAEERTAADQRRREEVAAAVRERHLQDLAARGNRAWLEAETFIAMRNPAGYDRATALLTDLGTLADRSDNYEDYTLRLAELRARHAAKSTFIERLDAAGLPAKSSLPLPDIRRAASGR